MKADGLRVFPQKMTIAHALSTLLPFSIIVAVFLSLGIASAHRGQSSADDAWISLSAKNLATGKGYTSSLSSNRQLQLDPAISTGPPLVLPTATAIYLSGNLPWIPGAVQFSMFLAQLTLAALLLSRCYGWLASLSFMTLLVFLLINISLNRHNWFYGALLGEPVAFGFIFLGIILLTYRSTLWSPLIAGILFSLAFLTKLISLFPIVGVVGAWTLVELYNKNPLSLIFKQTLALSTGFLFLPLIFEAIKIYELGLEVYLKILELTADAATPKTGSGYYDRFLSVVNILLEQYFIPILPVLALLIPALVLLFLRNKHKKTTRTYTIFTLVFGGITANFLYMVLYSPHLWSRYCWIGVALAAIFVALPLLTASARQRMVFFITASIMLPLFNAFDPLFEIYERQHNHLIADERAQVVSYLDEHLDTPYAAQNWTSIYDVVYLRKNEGSWRCGKHLQDLYGQDFIALFNADFTLKNSDFYRIVNTRCEPISQFKHFSLLHCSKPFWIDYGTKSRPGCAHVDVDALSKHGQ